MKTIYLTGYKGKNLGDDLFFLHTIKRYKDYNIVFEDVSDGFYSKLFCKYHNVSVLPHKRLGLLKKCLYKTTKLFNLELKSQLWPLYNRNNTIKADVFLRIGGSIFIEPPANKKRSLKVFKLAKQYFGDIPFFYIGCNFGPYYSSRYLNYTREIISNCNDVCFRDSYSYMMFKDLNSTRLAPDVLFGLNISNNIRKIHSSIGISVIDLRHRPGLSSFHQNYLSSIATYVSNNNFEVIRLFSFCNSEYDTVAINELKSLLPKNIQTKVELVIYDGNINEFLLKLSEVEILVATRFHSMILGFLYGINTIPIIYSKKMVNIINDMQACINYVNIEDITWQRIQEAVVSNKMVDIEKQRRDSNEQFRALDEYINK